MKRTSHINRTFARISAVFVLMLAMLMPAMPAMAAKTDSSSNSAKASQEQALARVNINKADANAIAKALKGVGKSKAAAIVSYREQYGNFKSIDQLIEVKGIGKSTLDRNRERIQL